MDASQQKSPVEFGLWWKEISYSVPAKGKEKWILCGVSGVASAGSFFAILGPSGSGKTTLLKVLALRLESVKGARLGGKVESKLMDGGAVAYVAQDTGFFSCLTVQETLKFHVGLRGDAVGSVEAQVAGVVQRLGLQDCQHTLVGGDSGGSQIVGISGGEKRRLAIGTQIAGTKNIGAIIADEPTTGLDTFQAAKVAATLSGLAVSQGAAVVCSLHAPRSSIFQDIHQVMLMSTGGRVVYTGPSSDALNYFESLGHACPTHFNPGEFLVDLISVDTSTPQDASKSEKRIQGLQYAWEEHQPQVILPSEDLSTTTTSVKEESGENSTKGKKGSQASLTGQPGSNSTSSGGTGRVKKFLALAQRALRQQVRDKTLNVSRGIASVVLGLALGTVNFQLGKTQASIRSRASLLMQMCINVAMISSTKSLSAFSRERRIVTQEIANGKREANAGADSGGGYSVGSYMLAKLCVETPLDAAYAMLFAAVAGRLAKLNPRSRRSLLGVAGLQAAAASSVGLGVSAVTPSVEAAQALGPVVMVLSLMLGDTGGMFAPVPASLKPLARLSCIKWGFQGCMVAEFAGLKFEKDVEGLVPQSMQGSSSDEEKKESGWKSIFLRGGKKAQEDAERAALEKMCMGTGEEVLEKMGVSGLSVAGNARAQLCLLGTNIVITYLAMRAQGQASGLKLQPFVANVKAPSVGAIAE